MRRVTLTIAVELDTDDDGAQRVARKLAYAADVLAADGMLTPDDMELETWTATTEIRTVITETRGPELAAIDPADFEGGTE